MQQQNVTVGLGQLQRWHQLEPRLIASEGLTTRRMFDIFGIAAAERVQRQFVIVGFGNLHALNR